MRKEYDFSRLKGRRNPYVGGLTERVSLRLGTDTIAYFKELAAETGIPYQKLIDLYLRQCVMEKKRPVLEWVS